MAAPTPATVDHKLRNVIHNGTFNVWQRGTSFTAQTGTVIKADRWKVRASGGGSLDIAQVEDARSAGFASMKVTVNGTDSSIAASDSYHLQQVIEGYDTQELQGRTCSVTFWAKSDVAGTYYVAIQNAATDRSYVMPYTIDTASTWERKALTFTHDTTGTWPLDEAAGASIIFSLQCGTDFHASSDETWAGADDRQGTTTNTFMSTNGNAFELSEVALFVDENGYAQSSLNVVPPVRSYAEELALCQRYFIRTGNGGQVYDTHGSGHASHTTRAYGKRFLSTPMRAVPSLSVSGATDFVVHHAATLTATTAITVDTVACSPQVLSFFATVASGLTVGHATSTLNNNKTTAYMDWSAEI